jgi:hypothetical protein
MHAHGVYPHDMHAREVQRYAYERHPPIGCTLVGCMPVGYVLIFENSFVVLGRGTCTSWVGADVGLSCRIGRSLGKEPFRGT